MALLRRISNLFSRVALDHEIDAELQSHLQLRVDDNLAEGMSLEDARRDALLRFGNRTALKERTAEADVAMAIESLWADVRYALRQLRRSPSFMVTTTVILALGIGASTAIFSAVNPILFQPLPYPHPSRIMVIWDVFKSARSDVTFHTYREVARRNHSFEWLAVMKAWQPTMIGPSEPERFDGQSVSADYLRVLGISPALGRDFTTSDDVPHGPYVVILSDGLWRRRFNSDPAIVGRQITLDGDHFTVIGVTPHGFENVLAPSAELWTPLQYNAANIAETGSREWGHHLSMAGRLRPGVSREKAKDELDAIARNPVPELPRVAWASLSFGFIVNSLQTDVTRSVKPALLAVMGAVILVLIIACVNVTNLLVARGGQRRGELAVRATLGAGRLRMMRQLVTESLVLAILGGALGMVVAEAGVRALIAMSPPGLPRLSSIRVDGTVFAFGLAITTLAGLFAGLIPLFNTVRKDLHIGIQQSSRRVTGSHRWARQVLVMAEVALALVLLVGAGLLLRSMQQLLSIAPGFDAAGLLTMQVETAGHRYDEGAIHRFFGRSLEEVRKVPGVKEAAYSSLLPLGGDLYGRYGVTFEDGSKDSAFRYVVTPEYFETMGIARRRGRLLDVHDVAGSAPVVVVSESLAKRYFKDGDPLGRLVHVGPENRPYYTIVGVVGDVKQSSLADAEQDAAYITPEQSWFADSTLTLVVRSQGNAAALAAAVRRAIWSVDKDQPITKVATMDHLLALSAAQRRFALSLFEAFALVALVLAATGIYGVMAGNVTERRREIGVRSAMGATRGDILTLVIRQGMRLTAIGALVGLAAAVAASQGLATMLFGVSTLDAITYLGVVALLGAVSVIACWVPAHRAAAVNPVEALRAE